MTGIFTADFKATPFWWDGGGGDGDDAAGNGGDDGANGAGDGANGGDDGANGADDGANGNLPASADVVIIGGGYTGLSAAVVTAGGGMDTVVIDADAAGNGCSSRNGGQVSTSIKPTFAQLQKKFGDTAALAILNEGNNALEFVESFIKKNKIACDFNKVGRFFGAHSPSAFNALIKKVNATPPSLNINAHIVGRDEVRDEVATDFYCGGVVYPKHASLHPARYHRGLLKCARDAGATVVEHRRVSKIKQANGKFTVTTGDGTVTADAVIVATSGYTGAATPYHRRRIIPIGSYTIATEPLPAATIARLLPTNRVVTDTRKLVVYYRADPSRKRILFGGRVSLRETDLRVSARQLHAEMLRVFPDLAGARVSHSWMGFVDYTFDTLPHTGVRGGVHYALGYCGSGVSLASYLGMKVGRRVVSERVGDHRCPAGDHRDAAGGNGDRAVGSGGIAGDHVGDAGDRAGGTGDDVGGGGDRAGGDGGDGDDAGGGGDRVGGVGGDDGATALADTPFPGRPWYRGDPWFLAPAVAYYRWRDRWWRW